MENIRLWLTASIAAIALNACAANETKPFEDAPAQTTQTSEAYPAFGRIVVLHPALADHVAPGAKVEKLAEGFWWSEGPSWDKKRNQLYFTDVPQNKMFVWSEREGLKTFLDPSGIDVSTLPQKVQDETREAGVNGTWMLGDDTLVMANHGKRAIEKLNLETGEREIIVDNFNGNKFTSPNDLVLAKNGDIYFTDPPFGYKGLNDSFMKEIPHNGVYKYSASDGSVSLIDDSLNRPNGIALSPDEQFLYVPHSDPKASKIMRYTLWDNGFENGEVWLDTQADLDSGLQGNPDGLAVAADGTVYSSGPGGVLVISPEGKLLGRIMVGDDPMGKPTANCTLGGPDGKTLYITSQDTLARVRVKSGRY
jgi:gluconolactonase